MTTGSRFEHPFEGVDVAKLDENFPSILAQATGSGSDEREEKKRGEAGLTKREKEIFRLGVLTELGEWDLAGRAIVSLMEAKMITGPEAERAAAEAVFVRGLPALVHLGPVLRACGLHNPSNVAEAIDAVLAIPVANMRLTQREIFALGLGLTWGARCWDT